MSGKPILMLTPFEPKGVVELIEVEPGNPPTAIVQFTHWHNGYSPGSIGRYYLSELKPATP